MLSVWIALKRRRWKIGGTHRRQDKSFQLEFKSEGEPRQFAERGGSQHLVWSANFKNWQDTHFSPISAYCQRWKIECQYNVHTQHRVLLTFSKLEFLYTQRCLSTPKGSLTSQTVISLNTLLISLVKVSHTLCKKWHFTWLVLNGKMIFCSSFLNTTKKKPLKLKSKGCFHWIPLLTTTAEEFAEHKEGGLLRVSDVVVVSTHITHIRRRSFHSRSSVVGLLLPVPRKPPPS